MQMTRELEDLMDLRSTEVITQRELAQYRAKENMIADLQAELAVAAQDVEDALVDGAEVEFGPHTAELKTVKGRRSIGWRGIVEREKGKGYAAQVFKSTNPGPDSQKLIIK